MWAASVANSSFPADFILENLLIQTHVLPGSPFVPMSNGFYFVVPVVSTLKHGPAQP